MTGLVLSGVRPGQRFISGGVLLVNNTYQDRMRYRFHLRRPFIKSQPNIYGWGSYEHCWTLDDWKFDRGRLHAGLGYAFSKKLKTEVACLRHFVKKNMEFNRL